MRKRCYRCLQSTSFSEGVINWLEGIFVAKYRTLRLVVPASIATRRYFPCQLRLALG